MKLKNFSPILLAIGAFSISGFFAQTASAICQLSPVVERLGGLYENHYQLLVANTESEDLKEAYDNDECTIEAPLRLFGRPAVIGGYEHVLDVNSLRWILPSNADSIGSYLFENGTLTFLLPNNPQGAYDFLSDHSNPLGQWMLDTLHIRVRDDRTEIAYHVFLYTRTAEDLFLATTR